MAEQIRRRTIKADTIGAGLPCKNCGGKCMIQTRDERGPKRIACPECKGTGRTMETK